MFWIVGGITCCLALFILDSLEAEDGEVEISVLNYLIMFVLSWIGVFILILFHTFPVLKVRNLFKKRK